jgi:hypothetical protein
LSQSRRFLHIQFFRTKITSAVMPIDWIGFPSRVAGV